MTFQKPPKTAPTLVVPMELIIGNRYHTTWSRSPHMNWELKQILPSSGVVILRSKNATFECKITDLRIPLQGKRNTPAKAKQLLLAFKEQLELK